MTRRATVRRDVLDDTDGPMLIHGLQGFHGTSLLLPHVPALRPDPVLLEARYERFRQAGRPRSPHDATVAYAIATGIINRQDVPNALLEHLARALEFYAHAPSEE